MTGRDNPRSSHRLKGHDYSSRGMYFVTVCTTNRECILGDVVDGIVRLSEIGRVVEQQIHRTVQAFANITLDAYGIMPNHIHVLFDITAGQEEGAKQSRPNESGIQEDLSANAWPQRSDVWVRGAAAGSISAVVQNLKSISSRRINAMRGTPCAKVWQRDYYDRIVRDEAELQRIRTYILNNPARWAEDREHPSVQR